MGFFKDKSILNIGICTNLCLKNLGFCENRDTPLHMACKMGDLNKVKLLLEHGANPYLENNYGESQFKHNCS